MYQGRDRMPRGVGGDRTMPTRDRGDAAPHAAARVSGDMALGLFNGVLLSMLVWLPVLMWFWSHLVRRFPG